jgi:hypothetical protein
MGWAFIELIIIHIGGATQYNEGRITHLSLLYNAIARL